MIRVLFNTTYYIPPLVEITLRTNRNAWKDIPGSYEDGKWEFLLPPDDFSGNIEFKFALDRAQWMADPNIERTFIEGEEYSVGPDEVRFLDQDRKQPVREYGQVQRRYFEPPVSIAEPFDVI